jgi:hypothetical protein
VFGTDVVVLALATADSEPDLADSLCNKVRGGGPLRQPTLCAVVDFNTIIWCSQLTDSSFFLSYFLPSFLLLPFFYIFGTWSSSLF